MSNPGLILLLRLPRLVQQAPKLERGRRRQRLLDDANPQRRHATLTLALVHVQLHARTRRPLIAVGQASILMPKRPCLTLPVPVPACSAPALVLEEES